MSRDTGCCPHCWGRGGGRSKWSLRCRPEESKQQKIDASMWMYNCMWASLMLVLKRFGPDFGQILFLYYLHWFNNAFLMINGNLSVCCRVPSEIQTSQFFVEAINFIYFGSIYRLPIFFKLICLCANQFLFKFIVTFILG